MTNLKIARKIVVLLVGGTILIIGMALTFLPGPAIVVVPLGILILATEFAWARRLMKRFKALASIVESDSTATREDSNTEAGVANSDDSDLPE